MLSSISYWWVQPPFPPNGCTTGLIKINELSLVHATQQLVQSLPVTTHEESGQYVNSNVFMD